MNKKYLGLLVLGSWAVAFAASSGTIVPTADGTYTAWTPSTGATHYTLVDETSCNGTTDYVRTTTVGSRDSYVTSLASIPDGSTITSITISPCASRNTNKTAVMNVFYRLNGINSADQGSYSLSGTVPTQLASTTYSGLSVTKTSGTTLEAGAVLTSGTGGARLSNIMTSVTYTLNFSIFASAGLNGSISPAGTTTLAQGTNQTYIITPNSGYYISSLIVDGVPVTATSSYTFTNVQAGHTIVAGFTISPPAAPTNLVARATTTPFTSISLIWRDNSSIENGFEIERGTDGINFSLATTTAQNFSIFGSYNDGTGTSGVTYYYRVRAFSTLGGYSAYTNVSSSTMP